MSDTNAVPGQAPAAPPPPNLPPQPSATTVPGATQQPSWAQSPGASPSQAAMPPGAAAQPGMAPPPGVAPVAQKKGLGCWAIGAIVVGALLVIGALVTLVFAVFVANEVDDMANDSMGTTQSAPEVAGTGGVYATEELNSVDFLLADDEVLFNDSDLRVEVVDGELLVTSLNSEQFNMASWETTATPALLMSGQMSFPAATTATGQEVFGGVWVGMADDVDYVLMCSTEGGARLERLEPSTSTQDSAILQEFANAGCSDSFSLALEAYAPAGATSVELLGTLPSGETFTFSDPGSHGQLINYGLLVDAETAPVTLSASSIEVFKAP